MDGMYLQWGFSESGIELVSASATLKNINIDREDVETVYIEKNLED